MIEPVSNKVLVKIQHLMKLAQAGTNANESASAFAQAQALLFKHKLEMSDVEKASAALNEEIIEGAKFLYEGKRAIAWKSRLAGGICQLNACRYYIKRTRNGMKYAVVGRNSDIEVVHYLFNSIVEQIEIFSQDALNKCLIEGKTGSNNFKHAAAEKVISRLEETQRQIREEYKGTTALVFVDSKDAEVAKWVEKNLNLVYKSFGGHRGDDSAASLGRQAGGKVSLNKGMNGSSGTKGYLT